MLFVENEPNKDPRINLAIEEYLIKSVAPKEEILLFYINKPSIIIGRNQNTIQEINVDYVQAHDIIVVRRLSGGGAVYHDLGNLNFSFIAPNSPGNFHNFRKFTQPVIKALMRMGVPAGPVNTVPQAFEQAHAHHRRMRVDGAGYRGLGLPMRLGRTPGHPGAPPPAFAQHAESVLREAGLTSEQIDRARQRGATPRRAAR